MRQRFDVTGNFENFCELRPCLVRKIFQDFPSHRIFGRIHGELNINKNKN